MKQRTAPGAAETQRGASIIQRAIWLMEHGKARGWSDAIEQARKATK
jgi:hypothetical protein